MTSVVERDTSRGLNVPPHSAEAEESVLGAVLMSAEAANIALEKLHAEKTQWAPLKAVIERVHGELLAEGQRAVERARAAIEEGRRQAAQDQLKQIEREYRTTAPGIAASLLLKQLRQKQSKGGG